MPASSDNDKLQMLVGFASRYRTGELGRGHQVRGATVATGVRHVTSVFELTGNADPRRPAGGQDLHLAFARLFSSYRNTDPASRPQIALPVAVFENINAHEGQSDRALERATADTITIAFYFLLGVGECTAPDRRPSTRTVQFRRSDVVFWQCQGRRKVRLPRDAPLHVLLQADEVTFTLSNQKNGIKDATLHHKRVPGGFCPVEAAAVSTTPPAAQSRSTPM
jgi:hypothetical protein